MVDAVGSLARARWVDICLTHDESYLVSNKIDLLIGPSRDTVNHVAMIDSIKVYGKSKEKFNWQDDECNNNNNNEPDYSGKSKSFENESEINKLKQQPSASYMQLDCLLSNSLDILENCLALFNTNSEEYSAERTYAFDISMKLISIMSPSIVNFRSKSLLYSSLATQKQKYLNAKDDAQLYNYI